MASKRSSRYTSGYTQKQELEDMNAYLSSENHFMKKKNDDLAKALSDLKIEHNNVLQGSYDLHERLFNENVERNKYKEFIRSMSQDVQTYIEQFIGLTEQMTNTLTKMNTVVKAPSALDHFINTPTPILATNTVRNRSRTVTVLPMVSGHTILSPKINLPRVTVKQLTDMMHSNGNEHISTDGMETDEIEFADNVLATSNEEHSDTTSHSSNEHVNERLETMQEEDEEEAEDETINTPMISGVFRDLKVYISPLNNQHIIKFKSKSAPRKTANKSKPYLNQSKNATLSPRNSQNSQTVSPRDSGEASCDLSTNNIQTQIWNQESNKTGNASNPTINAGEYDPLEGPSYLLNNTQGVLATPNETSTPCSPEFFRSKNSRATVNEVQTPTRVSKSIRYSKRTSNITKRRSKKRTGSSKMVPCTVKLQNLSPGKLRAYASSNCFSATNANDSGPDRPGSPTVLERSRRSSLSGSQLSKGNSKADADSVSATPMLREKRIRKPVVYKEPSLHKKLRRSRP